MIILKNLIKNILLSTTDYLTKQKNPIEKDALLLIRLDAIGDYILFRNFIMSLKGGAKYEKYQITLVGNVAWKSIAEELDSDFIDRFVWIDTKQFQRNISYRAKKIKEITKNGYEILINPTFSRSFFVDDSIVKVVNAKEKIGNRGDLSNIKKWQKNISDKYYTKLLPAKDEIMFEFYRNREFFKSLIGENIPIHRPMIELKQRTLEIDLPKKKFCILFIGASSSFRKWHIENFVEIGEFIKNKYDLDIVLCGGPTDIGDAKVFSELAQYQYLDLVGKTSLVDFMYIVHECDMIISNETSAPHFAVALGKKNIFVLFNGNHFGRFIPYPKEIWPYYYPIYHPEIEKNIEQYKKLSNTYGYGSSLNINEISIKSVKNKIELVME